MGSAVGSIFTGPFSETFGRNAVYIGTLLLFMVWIMASALSPNIGAQLTFRFFAGIFGCAPLTCAGGTMADLWTGFEKTYAFAIFFAIPAFGGATLGPVIGSYIGTGSLPSWRWTEWITLIMAGLVTILVTLFLPETHPDTLLSWKAKSVRRSTGNNMYRSQREVNPQSFWIRVKTSLTRPWRLAFEPIVLSMTVYLTIIWAVLFTFLDGYTSIFRMTYGISQGMTSIMFIAMYVGIVVAAPMVAVIYTWTLKDTAHQKDTSRPRPETRLWSAMWGGSWAIPVSLFWLAWTDFVSVEVREITGI